MMFEAIPNVSLAGKKDLLPALEQAIRVSFSAENPGKLLNTHFDPDHNRAVFTYIGTKQAIIQASLSLLSEAFNNICLEEHRGIHPFRGIVDVLPVVSIDQNKQKEAVKIATEIGTRAKALFGVPVFYYEKNSGNSISLPEMRNFLAQNSNKLGIDTKRGALITGAREFLVAYNINLSCNDLELAKRVAAQLREKNSGLPGVRALGLALHSKNQVQVSFNLTQPFKVTTKIIYNEVKSLLKTLKKECLTMEEELVGLLPETVIEEAKKLEQENG